MPANGLKPTESNPWRWVPSLYLIEGLPNALVVTVAVVMLKNLGLNNGLVALYTSLLYLPWVIKPLWSPFVDIIGSKRRWIGAMQLTLGAAMAAIALSLSMPWWLAGALTGFWAAALASATHDIAADGFYLLALDRREQAFFVGIRSTFYRLATLLASGGVVWLAGRAMARGIEPTPAWQMIFGGLGALFLLAAIWHRIALPHPEADRAALARSAGEVMREFALTFKTFFQRRNIGVALLFMLLYRLPEAFLCKMVQPFLLDPAAEGGLGLTVEQVGLANGTFGVIGIVLGGIVGGIVMSRAGLRRCLWPMALALTVPSGFYCYLALTQTTNMAVICSGIALEQFGYGFGFTAYMMYLMVFSKGSEFATSHYAFSTGIMALGLMLPGIIAGHLELAVGYSAFFGIVMILCVPTLAVTYLVRRTV
ncbi:MAG: AmpG family muropeptide MFS transporter [Bacteroidales bacterium]|nr:AmpG family muropeptide MFS transporter [Bacteroidales bacterium]